MKRSIITMISVLLTSALYAQVSIGKDTVEGNATILDFGTTDQGIVLPWVTNVTAVSSPAKGTLVYDYNTKKVRVYNGTTWIDLSKETGEMVSAPESHSRTEAGSGVTLGNDNTGAVGALVLDDATKAMILPKAAKPYQTLNAEAGTIIYDTVDKVICVYDGKQWSFWGN